MITPPAALHALLFASGEPIEKKQVAKLMKLSEEELVVVTKALTETLKESGVMLVETDSEIELRTVPEASSIVKQLRENELSRDLGKGSLETLAVIAYQTGATRGDIDWVRGVNSSASIRTLLMRGLIEGKEDDKDKRRVRYVLTTEALAHLGISQSLDLPRAEELRSTTQEIIEGRETEAA